MRELWLLRHAKSAWNSNVPTDFARPLNKRGRSDAPRLGCWMKSRGLVPGLVFSSDAARAADRGTGDTRVGTRQRGYPLRAPVISGFLR